MTIGLRCQWLLRSRCGADDAGCIKWIVMAQPFLGLLIVGVMEYAHPLINEPSILTRADMISADYATKKGKFIKISAATLEPR